MVVVELGQLGGLVEGLLYAAELIHELDPLGVQGQVHMALGNLVHLGHAHPAALGHTGEESAVAPLDAPLDEAHLLGGHGAAGLADGGVPVGLHLVKLDAQLVGQQA